jgi:hypothetical protein
MGYAIDARHGAIDRGSISDITLDNLDTIRPPKLFESRPIDAVKVVEYTNSPASLNELARHDAADEARAARHEDGF